MSDSSRHNLFQVEEQVYGVTPATPTLKTIRHTGTTLALTKDTFASEELRADRQIACFQHGNKAVSGDINFEFSAETYDDALEAVLGGTWTDDVLEAGVERRSFTIVRNFTDISDKPFHNFTGCEYSTFSLTVAPNTITNGTFGVVGKDLALAATNFVDLVEVLPPSSDCPYNSFTGVLKEGGVVTNIVTEVSLSLENGLEPRYVVGSDTTIRPSIGKSNLTGSLTVFFEDSVMLEKFINETPSSLEFTLQKGAKIYTFNLDNISFTGGQPDVSGEGSIPLTMPFQALASQAGSNIKITRVLA